MRKNPKPFFYLPLLTVGLLLGGAAAIFWLMQPKEQDRVQASMMAPKEQALLPATGLAQTQLTLAPGTTLVPVPTAFPAVAWGSPPPCSNNPLPVSAAAQAIAAPAQNGTANSDLRRAMLVSPGLAALPAEEVRGLAGAQPSSDERQMLLGLAVNVATGRLSRATQVQFSDLPEIKTVGDVLDRLDASLKGQPASPALLQAAEDIQNGKGITLPVCAHLLYTQGQNRPAALQWTANAISAQSIQAPEKLRVAMDMVVASPDGRRAAYTSVGNDSGGPVFVLDIQSGQWTNLIEAANAALAAGQPQLPIDAWWDVIGWLPDSQRLMIGPSDASSVYIIETATGKFSVIPFKGNGNGGSMFLDLSPDGSQFVYTGAVDGGNGQSLNLYNLSSGKVHSLFSMPYAAGVLYYPRFSPDGAAVSYIVQRGQPQTGLTYAIQQFSFEKNAVSTLAEGNLGFSVPTWSPDGKFVVFTKKDLDQPDLFNPEKPLDQPQNNLWVIDVATGKLEQITFLVGQVGRPHWAADARTLSFITQDGQVGMVNVERPGQLWRAAAGVPEFPDFSSASFLP